MKRTAQHQIDDLGEKLFESALKPQWTLQKQEKDYAIDYVVRVFEPATALAPSHRFVDTEPTGECFAVQLKSTSSLQTVGAFASIMLETKHLVYYADKEALPVFLVVADVFQGNSYWLFMQEYIDTHLQPAWRDRQRNTVHVPLANTLGPTQALRLAARDALAYMTGRLSTDVTNSILAHQKVLARIDPRFDVSVSATATQVTRTFHAKEPVNFSFEARFDTPDKHREFLRGAPVDFEPGEVVSDLPILAESIERGGVVQVGRTEKATIMVASARPPDRRPPILVDGELTTGVAGSRFRSKSEEVPLVVEIDFPDHRPGEIIAAVDLRRWRSESLLHLPHFEVIDDLFGSPEAHLQIQFIVDNRPSPPFPFAIPPAQPLHDLLDAIHKAREVADRLHVDAHFSDRFAAEQVDDILALHALVVSGSYRGPAHSRDVAVRLKNTAAGRAEARQILSHVGDTPVEVDLTGTFADRFTFFEYEVEIEMTRRTFNHFTVSPATRQAFRDIGKRGATKARLPPLLLKATPRAEMHLSSTGRIVAIRNKQETVA